LTVVAVPPPTLEKCAGDGKMSIATKGNPIMITEFDFILVGVAAVTPSGKERLK